MALLVLLTTGEQTWAQEEVLQDNELTVLDYRIVDTSDAGIHNPKAIAYSSNADLFFVLQPTTQNQYELFSITPYEHVIEQTTIGVATSGSIHMTVAQERESQGERLLILTADEVLELSIGWNGALAPVTSPIRHAISNWQVTDPQGLVVDAGSGKLYILDAATQTIVEIAPNAEGNFSNTTIASHITLALPSGASIRGLARDESTGVFYTLDTNGDVAYELAATGELQQSYSLAGVGLTAPQTLILAPSADNTDDPAALDLFVVDSIADTAQSAEPSVSAPTLGTSGRVVELFLTPRGGIKAVSATVNATLVQTTTTSTYVPPSPDPSGIAFLPNTNTLFIADGDVDETSIFVGNNLWQTTLSGAYVGSYSAIVPTDTKAVNEPVGIAYAAPGEYRTNAHLFISDDNQGGWITVVDLGADGTYGTADDLRSQFETSAFGSGDPAGIAYDSWNNALYIADGMNLEVYRIAPGSNGIFDGVAPGDDQVTHFDVSNLDIPDPEGIEFNPDNGHLYIMSRVNDKIAQMLPDGTPLQYINISDANAISPAGLAIAPSSTNPSDRHLYIVDRGIDNSLSNTQNDGMLIEMSFPPSGNFAPIVNAGEDQIIVISATVWLTGTVIDDGLPNPPSVITTTWSQVSGPGTVTFSAPSSTQTTATFSSSGVYVLRLTATDGELVTNDDIVVTVAASAGQAIVERRVTASADDAEEDGTDGSVSVTNGDLELGFDNATPQFVGVRFNTINIPRGATILNAYLQFTTDDSITASNTADLTIRGQAVDNATAFVTTTFNISSRATTITAVKWQPPHWSTAFEAGSSQRTPDITPIIQEIINRPGWNNGNSLAMIITGSGMRRAFSFNGNNANAPFLHITYTTGAIANTPPTSANDAYSVDEDTSLNVATVSGLLANDTDLDGNPLTAAKVSDPAHGSVMLNADGSFVYTPNPDFNGVDSFTYKANDGIADSNVATVTITVNSVNDVPIAANDNGIVVENGVLTVPAPGVLGNDTDVEDNPLTAVKVSDPAHGSVTLNANGSFVYTPAANFTGVDSFTYRAHDGSADSNVATVTITVGPANNTPTATNDSYSVNGDTVLSIVAPGVLGNDTDPGSNTLTAVKLSDPAHGTLTLNANGSFVYTPNAGYTGLDSFTYKASNGSADSNVATVTISVGLANNPPTATNDSYSVDEGTQLNIAAPGILSNDNDLDGHTLSAVKVSDPAHGTLTFSANGSFVYTPAANYSGSDSFTYKANDGSADSNIATVTITVNPDNGPVPTNEEMMFIPLLGR